ncbi:uncharacterized protein LOC134834699 [Culicoides brevitarsis]|uniref:uncharacterized protein LOC134834699 n=1 Tax=Culicoides brevitarsis TaxID=469753 RepID=UPI00307B28A7
MNKLIILGVLSCVLFATLQSASALKCYDCKVPNQECLLNYQDKQTDCDNELISGAISTVTGQKKVCVKYAAGQFSVRGCFIEGFCDNKEHCSSCDTDLCNGAENKMISSVTIITSALFIFLCKLFY